MESNSGYEFSLTSSVYSHEDHRTSPLEQQNQKRLEVSVIFTDAAGGLAALEMAEGLAKQLGAYLRLIMPYEVHYSLPLEAPPVMVEYLESQLRELAERTGLEIDAQVCLCREKRSALNKLLMPDSLIIVGGKKHWWPTAAQKLANALQDDGHHVIFAKQR